CHGPLARLFMPILIAHDRSRFHVTCYSSSPVRDSATVEMVRSADRWHECSSWDEDEWVGRIAGDEIDILVDLSGHCPGNRLLVFARRFAPVQMTFLDYV